MRKTVLILGLLFTALWFIGCSPKENEKYVLHKNITASTFWLNEGPSEYNGYITNTETAWADLAKHHLFTVNGTDAEDSPRIDAERDNDFILVGYDGNENPYYYALPYNDIGNLAFEDYDAPQSKLDAVVALDKTNYSKSGQDVLTKASTGNRKHNAKDISWYNTETSWNGKSVVKGRWIKVRCVESGKGNGEWVYAQWLDAGPYHYDDFNYIFGDSRPRNENKNTGVSPYAGIDLSPAVMLKIGISANSMNTPWGGTNTKVDWQFVDETDVPNGPWKRFTSDNKTNW